MLADGAGGVADCVVAGPVEGGLQLAVTAVRRLAPPDPRFVLVQALAKGDRGELAVELAVELGVDEVVPWAAARSVVRWEGAPRAAVAGALAVDRAGGGQAVPPGLAAVGGRAGVHPGRRRPDRAGGRGAGAARGGGRAARLGAAAGRR